MMKRVDAETNFFYNIVFSDEAMFQLKGMLNQRPNSDAEPVLPTKRTYTYTIYATRTHHYILIHQYFMRSHT